MYIEERDLDVEVFTAAHDAVRKRRDLSICERIVFAWLAGVVVRGFHPSHRLVAREVGVNKNTATRALKNLEEFGMIRVERRGSGRVSRYEIVAEASR